MGWTLQSCCLGRVSGLLCVGAGWRVGALGISGFRCCGPSSYPSSLTNGEGLPVTQTEFMAFFLPVILIFDSFPDGHRWRHC